MQVFMRLFCINNDGLMFFNKEEILLDREKINKINFIISKIFPACPRAYVRYTHIPAPVSIKNRKRKNYAKKKKNKKADFQCNRKKVS